MYDLIVIGGGPAALSATAYALGKQLKMLMIYESLGGKVGQHLGLRAEPDTDVDYVIGHLLVRMAFNDDKPIGEAQHAGEELVGLLERQIRARAGVAVCDRVLKVTAQGEGFEVQTLNHGLQRGTAVIVATGVAPQLLTVPGADAFLGHGLGYSVATYARQVEGKRVAVIGSTTRALRGAAELAQGADRVYLIRLNGAASGALLLDSLRARLNVEVLEGYQVVALEGDAGLERVVVDHYGQRRVLQVDAAFADLGLLPNSGLVRDLARLDEEGFILVDERNATTVPGLFAAGDVTSAFGEQVLIAIGDGARAALGAYDYILSRAMMHSLGGRD